MSNIRPDKLHGKLDMWAVVSESRGITEGVVATFKLERDAEEFRSTFMDGDMCVVKVTAELELIMEDD